MPLNQHQQNNTEKLLLYSDRKQSVCPAATARSSTITTNFPAPSLHIIFILDECLWKFKAPHAHFHTAMSLINSWCVRVHLVRRLYWYDKCISYHELLQVQNRIVLVRIS